ncbi:unknown protein [Microcystis aeruginosa NIES-843]|uniref:Uncharacterized protein n=1 Tax=Microcystis aeruginosa (strain NIES-843 / IAM M-2473) TaxID=449447 RepID=B0JGB9_MICAN|nr:unknown protein [Microcystis aeruginosa NIES-843]
MLGSVSRASKSSIAAALNWLFSFLCGSKKNRDNWLFWFLCGNEVYTDRISAK